jgi:hypothetical protein
MMMKVNSFVVSYSARPLCLSGRRTAPRLLVVYYTEKELPQPQDSSALGLENWNPPPISSVL